MMPFSKIFLHMLILLRIGLLQHIFYIKTKSVFIYFISNGTFYIKLVRNIVDLITIQTFVRNVFRCSELSTKLLSYLRFNSVENRFFII
jgi:hypothetical protein